MAVGDHQDARFARERKPSPNRTGLKRSNEWIYECASCGHRTRVKHNRGPEWCGELRPISGEVCGSEEFKVYNVISVEAMPIGRSHIDMRSPAQMGRKGKVR